MAVLAGRVLGAAELTEVERSVPSGDLRRSEDFGLGLFHWTTSCGVEDWVTVAPCMAPSSTGARRPAVLSP